MAINALNAYLGSLIDYVSVLSNYQGWLVLTRHSAPGCTITDRGFTLTKEK